MPNDRDISREASAITEIPEGIELSIKPPRALIKALEQSEGFQCGQRYSLTWDTGPWKGMPVTGYCAEPLCRDTGKCEGTRFVPHFDQYTSDDIDNPFRKKRILTKEEVIASVRQFAHKAAQQTGRDEDRNDKEILGFVKDVWIKTYRTIKHSEGDWKR